MAAVFIIGAVIAAIALYFTVTRKNSKYNYPPSPPGYNVLKGGHAHLLPPSFDLGPQISKWAEEYGDMFTLSMGGAKWVFLNKKKVVDDLLDKRSAIYSSRPDFPMTQDIISGGNRIVLMKYTDRWRSLRKIMHQLLTAKQADTYRPFQDLESKKLIYDLLQSPEKFPLHNRRYSNSVIMSVVFGRRTMTEDADVEALFHTIDLFLGNQVPGKWIVDGYPQLANIPKPLQWWRPYGEQCYRETVGVYRNFYKMFQEGLEKGNQKDCFATKFFAVADDFGFDQDQQMFVAGTLIEAGSDTTRNQNNLLMANAAHDPSWIPKVRAQLDEVCGHNAERLPEYDDWEKLTMIHATIKESLRYYPNLLQMGAPHALTKDDEYEGYRFEAGTVFVSNNHHINSNDAEYHDAKRFNPERFMNEHVLDVMEGHLGWGSGRRVCVGWNVGWKNMFITFSRMLYCFDFIEDPNHPIDVTRVPVFNTNQAPFNITIKPRSQAHADLIMKTCAYASKADVQVEKLKK